MDSSITGALHTLASAMRGAAHIAVLTGAGISAESGIPTFRDAMTGLWANYNPHDLATPEAFRRNPKLVWDWYAWRRQLVSGAAPNAGHRALAALEQMLPHFTLITQNVDSLHQRAGSRNVIELHGNLSRVTCFDEHVVVESWADTGSTPPRCPRCGGLLRPDVVWFGEALPRHAIRAAIAAAEQCDVFLSIGTSGTVEPAASLPWLAHRLGATVGIINPDLEPLSLPRVISLPGPVGSLLPALVDALAHHPDTPSH